MHSPRFVSHKRAAGLGTGACLLLLIFLFCLPASARFGVPVAAQPEVTRDALGLSNTRGMVDNVFPGLLANNRFAGIALFEGLAVLVGMPLLYFPTVLFGKQNLDDSRGGVG
jgi:hypothetical protein